MRRAFWGGKYGLLADGQCAEAMGAALFGNVIGIIIL